ncbi:hypothetical protein F1188_04040 [Roseospira marina]|uniref:Formyl transferase N-terminal domain-containing protein n=1 Tax=Roseospira marina TaxID=140057 RepID=A0A5M6IFQ7_9PROT|nr:formyltransferase family protein [Roseospira marina]KAA5607083.1 hypothetical protein F1188_04040 [Roseospira marina]MBB4312724.1 methionyl-tRNA formyltransferase [Roseospira marina]MBB5086503.1 methionyl-tRNA formyltransferase [Roseospira marina]
MTDAIILLVPAEEHEAAVEPLRLAAPNLTVVPVTHRSQLDAAVSHYPMARLLAFCTPVIVPADILSRLPGPSYNLHPGPPEYPGLHPAVFALYDNATAFGTTLHEMTPDVDAGRIVATNRVDLPPDMDRLGLEILSRRMAHHLLRSLAEDLVDVATPLPPMEITWARAARRAADFDALCRLPPDVDEAEFRRRLRAVGEGPYHALRVPLFGRWFRLEPEHPDALVVKAGVAVG